MAIRPVACIKALVGGIATSAVWELIAPEKAAPIAAAAITTAAAPAVLPIALGVGFVAAFLGLSLYNNKHEATEEKRLARALKAIDDNVEDSRQELLDLGIEQEFSAKKTRKRLAEIKALIQAARQPGADTEILDALARNETLAIYLGDFLAENFDQLKVHLKSLPTDVKELRDSFAELHTELRERLTRLQAGVDAANATLGAVKAAQQENGQALAELLEHARREKISEDELRRRVTAEIEQKYSSQLAAERSARESAERAAAAVVAVSRTPNITEEIRAKGGQAIVDALLADVKEPQAVTIETHRQIAEWAYLVGNIDQAKQSLDIILAALPDDLDATNRLGHIFSIRGDLPAARR